MDSEQTVPAMKYFLNEDQEPVWEIDPETGKSRPINRAAMYVEKGWKLKQPNEALPVKEHQPEAIYELNASGQLVPNEAARKQEDEVIRRAQAELPEKRD